MFCQLHGCGTLVRRAFPGSSDATLLQPETVLFFHDALCGRARLPRRREGGRAGIHPPIRHQFACGGGAAGADVEAARGIHAVRPGKGGRIGADGSGAERQCGPLGIQQEGRPDFPPARGHRKRMAGDAAEHDPPRAQCRIRKISQQPAPRHAGAADRSGHAVWLRHFRRQSICG